VATARYFNIHSLKRYDEMQAHSKQSSEAPSDASDGDVTRNASSREGEQGHSARILVAPDTTDINPWFSSFTPR